MWDQFSKTDILHVMNSTIPLFKSQPGYTMKINIAISKTVLHFFIEVMNNRNKRVSLLSYSRKMILSVMVILAVVLLYSDNLLKPDLNNLLWDFFWSGVSVVGIPLYKRLPRRIINFVVTKNINNLLGKKFRLEQDEKRIFDELGAYSRSLLYGLTI